MRATNSREANSFTGTILVEEKPRIERRKGLIHFIGATTGIRLAMSRDMFFELTSDAQAVVLEIGEELSGIARLRKKRKH